jgi:hypothetical protein
MTRAIDAKKTDTAAGEALAEVGVLTEGVTLAEGATPAAAGAAPAVGAAVGATLTGVASGAAIGRDTEAARGAARGVATGAEGAARGAASYMRQDSVLQSTSEIFLQVSKSIVGSAEQSVRLLWTTRINATNSYLCKTMESRSNWRKRNRRNHSSTGQWSCSKCFAVSVAGSIRLAQAVARTITRTEGDVIFGCIRAISAVNGCRDGLCCG